MHSGQPISQTLQHYVKEIYIIILGVGFVLFVQEGAFTNGLLDGGRWEIASLVYFCALYFFFTYDWIAYNTLMDSLPYAITARWQSLGRFYTDLFALLLKTFLIYLAAREASYLQVLCVAVLFAMWHCTICVWYAFARRENAKIPNITRSHIIMIIVYGIIAIAVYWAPEYRPDLIEEDHVRSWLLGISLLVFAHAAWRKHYLIKKFAVAP